jgi:hypothetical protein
MARFSGWQGKSEPADKSGVAKFSVAGAEIKVNLESFTDYQAISKLIDKAHEDGRRKALSDIQMRINAAFQKG